MSIRLMVLGAIDREKTTHGYKVYRELLLWRAETWSKVRPGSIYHALGQLSKEGLLSVSGTGEGKAGPARTSYAITAEGREELKRLVEWAMLEYDQEHFSAGLAFMHLLRREHVLNLAKQRLESFTQTAALMHILPQEQEPCTPARHPEIITSWTAIIEATAIWMKRFVLRLESGHYTFAGESSTRKSP